MKRLLKGIIGVLSVLLVAELCVMIFYLTAGNGRFIHNMDLGNKYLLEMEYDKAVRAFTEAIEIDMMNTDAYIGRGDAYFAMGDYANAWADYEQAQEISGDNTLLEHKFGRSEIHVSDEEGIPVADAEIEMNSGDRSYSLITGADGAASAIMFPGTYTVVINRNEYLDFEQIMDVCAGGGICDVELETAYVSFSYDVYNEFFLSGFSSKTAYTPDSWVLVDLDTDGIPEILFRENSEGWAATFELFYYDGTDGTVKKAGKYYEDYCEGVGYNSEKHLLILDGSMAATIYLNNCSYEDHIFEWLFYIGVERASVGNYTEYSIRHIDSDGTHDLGIYDLEGRDRILADYVGDPTWVELRPFVTGSSWNLSDADVQ